MTMSCRRLAAFVFVFFLLFVVSSQIQIVLGIEQKALGCKDRGREVARVRVGEGGNEEKNREEEESGKVEKRKGKNRNKMAKKERSKGEEQNEEKRRGREEGKEKKKGGWMQRREKGLKRGTTNSSMTTTTKTHTHTHT